MKFRAISALFLIAITIIALPPQLNALMEWTPIGPDGGDQFDIIISPADPNTLFALSNSALHRSTNAGMDWEAIHTKEISQFPVMSMVFDPVDPNHIFIANGNIGVWESIDSGENWTGCNQGLPLMAGYLVRYYSVVSLAFDVNGHLYAGMGLSNEEDLPPSWIYRSDNGCSNWTPHDTGIQITASGLTQKISTLLSADGNDQLWAMTHGAGVYIYDNGAWTSRNGDLPPEALQATFLLPDHSDSNHLLLGTEKNWIYETINGGQNWNAMALPDELHGLTVLPMVYAITMDPNNSQAIYVAARDFTESNEVLLFKPVNSEQMSGGDGYISFDGGMEWLKTINYLRVTIDPGETMTGAFPPFGDVTRSSIWYKTHGGLFGLRKSEDGGLSYQTITNGIRSLWVNRIWHYPLAGDYLFSASADSLHLCVDGSFPWEIQKPVEDNLYTWSFAEDYSDSNYIFYGTGNPAWSYTAQRGVYRIDYVNCFAEGCPPGDQMLTNVGVWRVITTSSQPDKIYAATQENGVMVSSDNGVNWDYLNDGLTLPQSITDMLLLQNGDPMLASARINNGDISADPPQDYQPSPDEEGTIYYYNPATLLWEPTPDITAATLDLELDPHDQQTIYAATVQGIYKSTDGINWDVVLPDNLVLDIVIDPINPGYFYAATRKNVIRSTDGGIQWHDFSNGLLKEWVYSLTLDDSTGILYAGTAGNSVYQLLPDPDPQPLLAVTPEILEFDIVPIGFSQDLEIALTNEGEANLTINDINPNNPSFTLPDLITPTILTPGGYYTTTIRFAPQTAGVILAHLTIQSNSSVTPSYDYPVSGEGRDAVLPVPDVKVNGSDGLITVVYGDPIVTDFYLSAGDYLGLAADYWISLTLPDATTYWLVEGEGWAESATPLPFACSPIADITVPLTATMTGMTSGDYELYFAVDDDLGGCDGLFDGTWTDTANFTVGLMPPGLETFPGSLEFEDVPVGFDKTLQMTIGNTGEQDLVIDSIGFDHPDFALDSPSVFPLTIVSGGNEIASIIFTPSATGAQSAGMTINSNDPVNPAFLVPLTGEGRDAVLPVPDAKVNGSDGPITVAYGEPMLTDYYLNAGDYGGLDADYWMRLTFPDAGTYWLVQGQGWVESASPLSFACLPVWDITEPLTATFTSVTSGDYELSFAVDDDPGGCDAVFDGMWVDTVDFTVALAPPNIEVFPALLNFEDVPVGFDKTLQVIINNIGEEDLVVDSIGFDLPDFTLDSPPVFPLTIIPGGNETVRIIFTPSVAGAQSVVMTINSNDPVDPALVFAISGNGVTAVLPVPDVKVNGSDSLITVAYGDPIVTDFYLNAGDYLGLAADHWIRLTFPDAGTYWLVQGQGWVESAAPLRFVCSPIANITNPLTTTLTSLPSGDYELYFAVDDDPGGCDSVFDGTWVDTVDFTVALAPPNLEIFSGPHDFGNVPIGLDKTIQVIIGNIGEQDLIINSIDLDLPDFALASPPAFPLTIISGGNEIINIIFTPSATGAQSAAMTINSNDPVDPAWLVSLSGNGVNVVLPVPDVKVNGGEGPLMISQGDNLTFTISLDAGNIAGEDADWWILIFKFNTGTSSLIPILNTGFQSPLFDLPLLTLINTTGLPGGTFIFLFGVDLNMNSVIDSPLYSDLEVVHIQ